MSIQENIGEMQIVPMLATVLEGNFPENSGSTKKRRPDEELIGTITSPASRRLFTALAKLSHHIRTVRPHGAHMDSTESLEACGDSSGGNILARLKERQRVVRGLLWQSIAEEHPRVLTSSVKIRNGWDLVACAQELQDSFTPAVDKKSVAWIFINRVAAIVCGRRVSVGEDDLGIVSLGEEVIGSLTDERVQTLRSLLAELRSDYIRQLPPKMAALNKAQRITDDMTPKELYQFHILVRHFSELQKLAASLFWCGVRDTVSSAADAELIGIRRAWDVVQHPPSKDPGEPTMVMTPDGPALQITIAIPDELLQALFGRKE